MSSGQQPGREVQISPSHQPGAISGSIYLGPERDLESSRRTLLAQSLAGSASPPEFSLLELADTIRREMEDTLASGTVSPARLAHIEETIASHVRLYTTAPPADALTRLLLDFMGVRRLSAERQPTPGAGPVVGAGDLARHARGRFADEARADRRGQRLVRHAKIAADDSSNREPRARVRAQQAMLPYYYGNPSEAVHLARDAQEILDDTPRAAGALAAAAEARALARMGRRAEAESAMARCQDLAGQVHEFDSDEAFRFGERRLLLYLSGALTNLGEAARASRIQERALELYGDSAPLIDPALIRLDQAHLLVLDHDLEGARELIRQACLSLGTDGVPGQRVRAAQEVGTTGHSGASSRSTSSPASPASVLAVRSSRSCQACSWSWPVAWSGRCWPMQ